MLVDDQVGLENAGGLLRAQLEVVRLTPGLGEAGDLAVASGDPLGDELEGVRRRHDRHLVGARRDLRRPGLTAAGDAERGGTGEQGSSAGPS